MSLKVGDWVVLSEERKLHLLTFHSALTYSGPYKICLIEGSAFGTREPDGPLGFLYNEDVIKVNLSELEKLIYEVSDSD
jgi:hypothetical protein